MKDEDQPWVSNYPPLDEWLRKIGARCMSQIRVGGTRTAPDRYVEFWFVLQRIFIVEVRSRKNGWNIYTDADTGKIDETFRDAEARLGISDQCEERQETAIS